MAASEPDKPPPTHTANQPEKPMMILSKPPTHLAGLLGLMVLIGLLSAPEQTQAQHPDQPSMVTQVAAALCDKQVVLLGELPSHGEARAFQAKAQIVEHLVSRCGFEAVFFEAPIYDFLGLEQALAAGHAEALQLDRAIGGFWLNRELKAWRGWLFDQATEGRVRLGGLDDQVSATSDYARATLPDLIAAALPADQADACREAVVRNLYWRYDAEHPFDEAEQVRLQQCARLATDTPAAQAEHAEDALAPVMLENLASLYDRQRNAAGALDRDAVLYRNFRQLRERLPEDAKVVVWTATVHAARQQGARKDKPLGTWLAAEWEDQLAAVGFSTYTGVSSMAGMPSKPIPEAPPGSLEALATESDTAWVYLDAAALQAMGVVPSRLMGRVTAADWSAYFDGVLVIREEVAPVFEPR